MGKQLTSRIDIDATPERVWQVLSEFGAYPQWNPFIVRAEGRAQAGSRLVMRMQPVGARGITLRPTVTQATPGHRLRWRGRLGLPGIFDAEHAFTITPRPEGGVWLSQDETFTGLLVPLMARSLDRHTLPAFEAMNAALKHRAEQSTAVQPTAAQRG
jgi:hypothetical protein